MRNLWTYLQAVAARHPRRALVIACLLVCLAAAAYLAVPHIRAEIHFQRAKKAFEKRQFEQADSHLKICLQTWPRSSRTHYLAAQVARRAERYEVAEEHLTRCEEVGGEIEFIDLERWMTQAQQGILSRELESNLRECVENEIQADLVLEALAKGFLRRMRTDEALECLDRLLERQPQDAWGRLARGRVLETMSRFEEAQDDFRRLLLQDPDHAEGQLRMARVQMRIGKPREALKRLERLWEQQPGDLAVGLELSRCCAHLGQLKKAAAVLRELAAKHSRAVPVLIEQGRQARQQGRLAQAEKSFRKAVRLAPFDFDANYSLFQTLLAQGKKDEASKYQIATKNIEKTIEAIRVAREAIQKKPADPDLRYRLGVLCFRLGQDQTGLDWLTSALHLNSHHAKTHAALADWYAKNHQKDKSAYHRDMARQIRPKPTRP